MQPVLAGNSVQECIMTEGTVIKGVSCTSQAQVDRPIRRNTKTWLLRKPLILQRNDRTFTLIACVWTSVPLSPTVAQAINHGYSTNSSSVVSSHYPAFTQLPLCLINFEFSFPRCLLFSDPLYLGFQAEENKPTSWLSAFFQLGYFCCCVLFFMVLTACAYFSVTLGRTHSVGLRHKTERKVGSEIHWNGNITAHYECLGLMVLREFYKTLFTLTLGHANRRMRKVEYLLNSSYHRLTMSILP